MKESVSGCFFSEHSVEGNTVAHSCETSLLLIGLDCAVFYVPANTV